MNWIGPETQEGMGNLGISVKVKVPKEIKEMAKSFPEMTKSMTQVSSAVDTFGPHYLAAAAMLGVAVIAAVVIFKKKD